MNTMMTKMKKIILFTVVAMMISTISIVSAVGSPTITAPPDVTKEATGIKTTVTPAELGYPTTTCGEPPCTVSNNAPVGGFSLDTTVVKWTIIDNLTVSATADQFVTIKDTTAPTITAPADINVQTTGTIVHIANLGTPIVNDLVDPNPKITNDAPAGNNFPIGQTTVTWQACDNSNNCNTATQLITVTNPPVQLTITAPADITQVATGIITHIANLGTPIVSGGTPPYTTNNNAPAGNNFPIGVTTIIWTTTDSVGTTAQAIQLITITQPAQLTITAPGPITQEATGITTHVANLGTPIVSGGIPPYTTGNNAPAGNNFPIGVTTIIWTTADSVGTTAQTIQLITIRDTTSPSIIPPPDITVRATGSVTHVNLGNATVSDLVDPNPIVTNYPPAGNNFPVGDTTVMWKACDHSGNCNTATQLVMVLPQGAIIISHNPVWSINRTAPSTVEFNITTDQVVNVTWNLDGAHVVGSDFYSTTYASYVGTIYKIGNHVVTVYIENENGSYDKSWNWSVKGGLKISANLPSVNVGQPTNVTFTVTRKCGIEDGDNQTYCAIQPDIPFSGASVYITGVIGNNTGSGITDTNGQTVILVNATSTGIVTATASKPPRYKDDSTNITAGTPPPPSSGGGGGGSSSGNSGSGSSSGSSSGSGGGGGGSSSAEPYDNILKYESRETFIGLTPVTLKYTTPEIAVYEVAIAGDDSNSVTLRIEVLRDTSKLVGMQAPGTVYKNINMWADSKRIKNAVIRYKIENSWISNSGVPQSDIRMSRWDNTTKKWNELPTNVTSRDDSNTYFESTTEGFSSFAINSIGNNVPYATNGATPGNTGSPILNGTQGSNPVDTLGKRKDPIIFEIAASIIIIALAVYLIRVKKN